jgi:hypothetical protein
VLGLTLSAVVAFLVVAKARDFEKRHELVSNQQVAENTLIREGVKEHTHAHTRHELVTNQHLAEADLKGLCFFFVFRNKQKKIEIYFYCRCMRSTQRKQVS